jgi:hypothetical protein
MRFVPIKIIEQQSALSSHRVRHGFELAGTAQACHVAGTPCGSVSMLPRWLRRTQEVQKKLAGHSPRSQP